MEIREIVDRWIVPDDPALARRIMSLVWCYERTRLRHSVAHDPLSRRDEARLPAKHATGVDTVGDAAY